MLLRYKVGGFLPLTIARAASDAVGVIWQCIPHSCAFFSIISAA
ncbi:Uncharacterised protein [Vibrio cholerae]|nr:Uncharacterised protein [Vibrio cholerae]CSI43560.1 Uncharacterised protein [Vibrio cholerae]